MQEKGNLSINSENILPIIKKWLYSDTDIFVRELVSNAADAVTKLLRLDAIGEADIPNDEKFFIKIILDKAKGTIKFVDNGIGMTADEVKQYINQIAFSGATEFINKYKDKMDAGNEIIGHFGLGFYSAFMAASKVQIDTLSFQKGADAARWICEGGVDYVMEDSDKTGRGTEITLTVNDEAKEFLEDYKLRSVLKKYCSFIPIDIYFENAAGMDKEDDRIKEKDEDLTEDRSEDKEDDKKQEKKPEIINDTKPLWTKAANECSDEDYKKFYHNVFMDYNEPLFWIHLNMDHPFRLKGILYFPKLKHELESIEGQVKLYSNQVFIADNIKEVIPEFLLLLKGVIDCPDLPLNVSRSFLQNDGYVSKMSAYITRKVADKLTSLCKNEREVYNKYWDDINQFIKYGCLRDMEFYDKCKAAVLYKSAKGEYFTLGEYLERNEAKTGKKVFYVSNPKQQSRYVSLFDEQGIDAALMETRLDNPFMSYVESKEDGLKFQRIDSDLSDVFKDGDDSFKDGDKAQSEQLEALFKKSLGNDKLKISVESLKASNVPAIILLSEESRRMQEMSHMFGGMNFGGEMLGNDEKLVVNRNNDLVKTLISIGGKDGKTEEIDLICKHLYDLALMSHKPLESAAMNEFIERSNKLLAIVANANSYMERHN